MQPQIQHNNVRLTNILRSPKRNGSADIDSARYLTELGVSLEENRQSIQFSPNYNERIHRWAPYVQGFSASFVQSVIDKYAGNYSDPYVMDPFAGCGTVLVQAKFNGIKSFGVELNPFLQFIANIKLNSWDISPRAFLDVYKSLSYENIIIATPQFLKSDKQFKKGIIENLLKIKSAIYSYESNNIKQSKIRDMLKLAFSAILVESSNLKRSPCLGYDKTKIVQDYTPLILFNQKIHQIADDLTLLQKDFNECLKIPSQIVCANSMTFNFPSKYDLIITSPPYMNGMDYVINYKIEMGWLDFIQNHSAAKKIKDEMVVCDNVSKGLIRNFSKNARYTNKWIEDIKTEIAQNIGIRGSYRRKDMPEIVHKYFDDMYKIMKNVVKSMNEGGRFILVIGDSLIADVYIPTDLIVAKIGQDLGLTIESLEIARNRRSGQVRSYRLRETILTLRK